MIVKLYEKLFVCNDFLAPGGAVHLHQFFEVLAREVQSRPVDIFVAGNPADRSFAAPAVSLVGGVDRLQRDLLGERVLGLPKAPLLEPTP